MRAFAVVGAVLLVLSVANFALGNLTIGFSSLSIACVCFFQSSQKRRH